MKIVTAWTWDPVYPNEAPTMISSYDEFTWESHGGVPEWYTNEVNEHRRTMDPREQIRELVININEGPVWDLFTTSETNGTVES